MQEICTYGTGNCQKVGLCWVNNVRQSLKDLEQSFRNPIRTRKPSKNVSVASQLPGTVRYFLLFKSYDFFPSQKSDPQTDQK